MPVGDTARNLTIQSPNFDRIKQESGYFTRDGIMLLWLGLNDTRAVESRDVAGIKAEFSVATLTLAPVVEQDNLDIRGYSILELNGSTAFNLTGLMAPDTSVAKFMFIVNDGSATVTIKNLSSSSQSQNQFSSQAGSDVSLTAGKASVWVYLSSKWRQVV